MMIAPHCCIYVHLCSDPYGPKSIRIYNVAAGYTSTINLASNNNPANRVDGTTLSTFFFDRPTHAIQIDNQYYILDSLAGVLYRATPGATNGVVTRVIGSYRAGGKCSPGLAQVSAAMSTPTFMEPKSSNFLFISDPGCHIVWGVDLNTNVLYVVAGMPGVRGNATGHATDIARLASPAGMAYDATRGRLYIADTGKC